MRHERHVRSQKAVCYLTGTSAYLTDPITTVHHPNCFRMPQMTPTVPDFQSITASYVLSMPSFVQQGLTTCEPGTTNLIYLTEITAFSTFFYIFPRLHLRSPSPVPNFPCTVFHLFGPFRATTVINCCKGMRKRQDLHCISVRALCRDPHVRCL